MFILNSTREYVTPGGNAIPKGSVIFRLDDTSWKPLWRY
jgi:hypothetical protein